MRNTKIVCTIGPASEKEETLCKIIEAGMSASRHNFSHGDHEEHAARIKMVKELSKRYNKHIPIILDTKGPEIRTGKFEGNKVELTSGSEFVIYAGEEVLGDATKCSVTYSGLAEDVKAGDRILIDDGLVGLEVKRVEGKKIYTIVSNSGVVGTHKGVNVPGVSIKLPAMTSKDIDDLKFGCEIGVNIIAASFIRKAEDVKAIREILNSNGGENIHIFSKIENQEGVDNIDEILEASDGIMVARGDLGVEIPIEKVPSVQKMIIEKCNRLGKPVITATQMLDSMIRNPRPTRAEVSDVANAILDGTDAIMLSGESANGSWPVESVRTMATIASEAEQHLTYESATLKLGKRAKTIGGAISRSTCNVAMELNAAAIITSTQSGSTARRVSRYRPECPIIAVTFHEHVAKQLALVWGVYPMLAEKIETTDEMIAQATEVAKQSGFVKKGDTVVLAAGLPINEIGSTNMLKVSIVE
ncbi:pyruvate kinase [Clostridium amylolyticum]|uniref:Pyruvate kinase n=1 Tax=Clostridium amylolyticum TaxID=1121298 RepID=A0A1M6H328_9CLOT|nr:pyruvate kinase [Clostridium amylolyticum]SHJ16607.1 pyruvate kinase [Clostridium amylolyticum]